MIKKPKLKSKTYFQKKADRVYQEIFVKTHPKCLVCGRPTSCAHHFVKKSQSIALRYDFSNGIPICNSCHCAIHQGKSDIVTAQIVLLMGEMWFIELMNKKRQGLGLNYGRLWFEKKYNDLKKFL